MADPSNLLSDVQLLIQDGSHRRFSYSQWDAQPAMLIAQPQDSQAVDTAMEDKYFTCPRYV